MTASTTYTATEDDVWEALKPHGYRPRPESFGEILRAVEKTAGVEVKYSMGHVVKTGPTVAQAALKKLLAAMVETGQVAVYTQADSGPVEGLSLHHIRPGATYYLRADAYRAAREAGDRAQALNALGAAQAAALKALAREFPQRYQELVEAHLRGDADRS